MNSQNSVDVANSMNNTDGTHSTGKKSKMPFKRNDSKERTISVGDRASASPNTQRRTNAEVAAFRIGNNTSQVTNHSVMVVDQEEEH